MSGRVALGLMSPPFNDRGRSQPAPHPLPVAAQDVCPIELPASPRVGGMRDRWGVDARPLGGGSATGLGVVLGMFGNDNTPHDPFGWEATDSEGWLGIVGDVGERGECG
ncbi:MAG: hypothetical protein F4X74_04500 [Acidimicrobiia bacterium]|nr:hypothetical protein [Acidimicrobiia bacterium]